MLTKLKDIFVFSAQLYLNFLRCPLLIDVTAHLNADVTWFWLGGRVLFLEFSKLLKMVGNKEARVCFCTVSPCVRRGGRR